MKFSVVNKSNQDMSRLEPFVNDFVPYAQKYMKFSKTPTIEYLSDQDNAAKTLGRTAYYDPNSHTVALYVDGRHPKDVLRSLSHELVHHTQNCRGDLSGPNVAAEEGYAQSNPHMREMEREAYETGNLCFRDWEDTRRDYLQENNYFERRNVMSTKQWKDKELNRLLMEKWGYNLPESTEEEVVEEEEKEEIEEGQWQSNIDAHYAERDSDEGEAEPLTTEELFALMSAGWGPDQLRGLNKGNLPPEADAILHPERGAASREPLTTEELFALMDVGWGADQLRGLNKGNLPPEAIEILQAKGLMENKEELDESWADDDAGGEQRKYEKEKGYRKKGYSSPTDPSKEKKSKKGKKTK